MTVYSRGPQPFFSFRPDHVPDAGGDWEVQEQAKYGDIVFLRKGSGVGYRSIVYKVRSPRRPPPLVPCLR